MGKASDLRRELKARFLPSLAARGFAIDMRDAPTFARCRRGVGDSVEILEVQWDKYGRPRFVINFGTCPVEGIQVGVERFAVESVSVGWLSVSGRLQPRRGSSTSAWFSQEKPLLHRLFSSSRLRSPESVVQDLLDLFPEVEAYWAHGTIGRHLTLFRTPRPDEAGRPTRVSGPLRQGE